MGKYLVIKGADFSEVAVEQVNLSELEPTQEINLSDYLIPNVANMNNTIWMSGLQGYSGVCIPCSPGDKFTINYKEPVSNEALYVWLNANDTRVGTVNYVSWAAISEETVTVEAPQGAVSLYCLYSNSSGVQLDKIMKELL